MHSTAAPDHRGWAEYIAIENFTSTMDLGVFIDQIDQ